jgi:hypothetical protein
MSAPSTDTKDVHGIEKRTSSDVTSVETFATKIDIFLDGADLTAVTSVSFFETEP